MPNVENLAARRRIPFQPLATPPKLGVGFCHAITTKYHLSWRKRRKTGRRWLAVSRGCIFSNVSSGSPFYAARLFSEAGWRTGRETRSRPRREEARNYSDAEELQRSSSSRYFISARASIARMARGKKDRGLWISGWRNPGISSRNDRINFFAFRATARLKNRNAPNLPQRTATFPAIFLLDATRRNDRCPGATSFLPLSLREWSTTNFRSMYQSRWPVLRIRDIRNFQRKFPVSQLAVGALFYS